MPVVITNKSAGFIPSVVPPIYAGIEDIKTLVQTVKTATPAPLLPSVLPGEIILLLGGIDSGSNNVTFPSASPDSDEWTVHFNGSTSPNTGVTLVIASKIATEEDSGANLSLTLGSSQHSIWHSLALSALKNGQSSLIGAGDTNGHNMNPVDFPSLSLPENNLWSFLATCINDDNRTPGTPTGYTTIATGQISGSGPAGLTFRVWNKEEVSEGPEDPSDVTISDNEHHETNTMGLQPRAAPLLESSQDMTILNPNFASDVSSWHNLVGTVTRSGNNGQDGTPGFAYGNNSADCQFYQDVPIPSDLHTAVDAGRVRAQVDYYGNSFGNDQEQLLLSWFDDESPQNQIGNEVENDVMGAHGGWVARQCVHAAPSGARALRIKGHAIRNQSSQNDGYFDSFSGLWRVFP